MKQYKSIYKGTEMDASWGKANTAVQGVKVNGEELPKDAEGKVGITLPETYTKDETDALLAEKQNTLVSGENIKTINDQSILGGGNIEINPEPSEYLKSASVSDNTLTLTKKDGTEVRYKTKRKNPEFYLPVVHRAVPLQSWQRGVIYRVGAVRFVAERVNGDTIEFDAPQYVCDWVHANQNLFSNRNLAIRCKDFDTQKVYFFDSLTDGVITVKSRSAFPSSIEGEKCGIIIRKDGISRPCVVRKVVDGEDVIVTFANEEVHTASPNFRIALGETYCIATANVAYESSKWFNRGKPTNINNGTLVRMFKNKVYKGETYKKWVRVGIVRLSGGSTDHTPHCTEAIPKICRAYAVRRYKVSKNFAEFILHKGKIK